jgi:hypothetical protein
MVFSCFLSGKRPQQGAFLLLKSCEMYNPNLGNDVLSTNFGTQLHFFNLKSIVRSHLPTIYPPFTNLPMSAKCYKNAIMMLTEVATLHDRSGKGQPIFKLMVS